MPMPMLRSPRRDKLFIIAEILELAKGGTLKTQLMYRANLSFAQLNDYLDFMLKIELLEMVHINGKEVYRATDKGLILHQRYHDINELLATAESGERECSRCHSKISLENRFCPNCGNDLQVKQVMVRAK